MTIPKPKNQMIKLSVAREDLATFLKRCKWRKSKSGREYLHISGWINEGVDKDGYNVFLYDRQLPNEYDKPKLLLMRGSSKEISDEKLRQMNEFKKENPELDEIIY